MKGKQINFYLTETEIKRIEEYLRKENILVLGNLMHTSEPILLDTLITSKPSFIKYLVPSNLKKEVITKYIDTQSYYLIDFFSSPVVEFSLPISKEKNILKRGRIYFLKENSNLDFLKFADTFFKWFKKTFRNIKLQNYEDILITEEVKNWLDQSTDHQLEDFHSYSSPETKRVA